MGYSLVFDGGWVCVEGEGEVEVAVVGGEEEGGGG